MQENSTITSPDQLNNYIRLTSSGIWFVLAAVVVLLAGLFMWLFTGTLDVSLHTSVFTSAGKTSAFIPMDGLYGISSGTPARLLDGSAAGTVTDIFYEPLSIREIEGIIGRNNAAGMMIDPSSRNLCEVSLSIPDAPQGISQAVIILDTVRPITFLLR